MSCDSGEVLVRGEQLDAGRYARLGNDAVDRAAHGDASAPEPAIKTSGGDVPVDVQREDREPKQQVSCPQEVVIGTESLQHFGEDQRDQSHVLGLQPVTEAVDLGRVRSFEPVGPNCGVDDDHRRWRRQASTSPSQGILPLSFRSARYT